MLFFIYLIISFNIILSNDNVMENSFINAQTLFEDGAYLDAKIMFESLEEKNEDLFYLGYQIYYELDDLNRANEFLQEAIKLNEDKYIELGDKLGLFINELNNAKVTLNNGYYDDAVNELTLLLDKHPSSSIVYFRLGHVYDKQKNYDKAAENFKRAVDLNPFNTTYSDAIIRLIKIQESLGHDEYIRQDYQVALEYFDKALSYDSTYAPVMFRIGNIYYKIKDYDKAIEYYKNGLEHSDISSNKYKLLNQLGKFYTKVNRYDKAMESFNMVLDINPGYVPSIFEKAKIMKARGEINDSKNLLLQITNIDPTYVSAYELLMDIENDMKNFKQALEYGNMCLDFNPSSYTVNGRMASIYNEQKDFNKAKSYAKESLKIKRKYAPALFELGIAELNMCNKVAAKDAFNKSKSDKRYRKVSNDYIKNLDIYTKDCD